MIVAVGSLCIYSKFYNNCVEIFVENTRRNIWFRSRGQFAGGAGHG